MHVTHEKQFIKLWDNSKKKAIIVIRKIKVSQ